MAIIIKYENKIIICLKISLKFIKILLITATKNSKKFFQCLSSILNIGWRGSSLFVIIELNTSNLIYFFEGSNL